MFEDKYIKIIRFIHEREVTTYGEIADMLHVSTKTVGKYIEDVQGILNGGGLTLSIKPGHGVSILDAKEKVQDFFNHLSIKSVDTIEDREIYVYSQLLNTNEYLKIQDLADYMYVSRATMEKTIREVRKKFLQENIQIVSTHKGLKLQATEKQRRKLMSSVINYYWGGVRATQDMAEELKVNISMLNHTKDIVDLENLDKISTILNRFIELSELNITDYEYQSLVIHLVIAMERITKNFYIDQPIQAGGILLPNATLLISLLEKYLEIEIPKYEKEYINIHISAIEKNTLNTKDEINIEVLDLSERLKNILMIVLAMYLPDEELIKNLIVHLNAAVKRLQLGLNIHNPYTDKIRTTFPHSFEVAVEIIGALEKEFDIVFNDDEIAYVSLHIQTFFDREPNIKNVVVVCSSGYGTSKLLEQRLKQHFAKRINITKVLSLRELQTTDVTEQLIISTIPIENSIVPVVVVSPLMMDKDIQKIEPYLGMKNKKTYEIFASLIKKEFIFLSTKKNETQNHVLQVISNQLLDLGYAFTGVLESAKNREHLSSTAMGMFAMPHADIKYIHSPCISIYINSHGISWGNQKVQLVFFFALNTQVKTDINEIYAFFNELVSNHSIMKKLVEVQNIKEIETLLKEANV